MRTEKIGTGLIGAVLAFVISLGAVGAMITGFDLNIESMGKIVLTCAFFAALASVLFSFRWGGVVLACLLAPAAGYLWHRGYAQEQLLALVYRISYVYDRAYGCGVLKLVEGRWDSWISDIPMAVTGCLIAIAVSRTVCRGKTATLAVTVAMLPLALCMVVTDTVPDEGYLFVLMAGLVVLILTNGVRRENPAQGNRLTAMLAVPAAIAMALLFLAVPQEGYVNQSEEIRTQIVSYVENLPQFVESTAEEITVNIQGGEQEEVNLKTLGARPRYTYPVMDVTAGETGRLYLRGQDYDVYSGTGWTSAVHRAEEFSYAGEPGGEVTIRTRSRKDILYLPYYPGEETTLAGGRLRNTEGLREYTFSYSSLPENWHDIATAPEEITESGVELTAPILKVVDAQAILDRNRYLVLSDATDAAARGILEKIALSGSTTEQAEAIASYVRNSADYDLNTGRMPSGEEDFALWFLENSDTGYCVHFATAAVVLLRAADIPARYVSGYLVQAQAGQTVTVTAEDAHAWAEYYDSRLGAWLVLEATPADPGREVAATQSSEPESTRPVQTETYPNATEQGETPTVTKPDAPTVSEVPKPQQESSGKRGSGVWLLILAVILAALPIQRSVRLGLRKQKQRSGDANAQALVRWRETEYLSKLLGWTVPGELTALAQKAKFSQHSLSKEELACFDAYLRTCRQQLRESPWYLRLVYQYIFAAY